MLQHQMLPQLSRIGLALFLLGAGVTAPLPASAETFPTRTIRIVVPTSPATPPDIISRIIASELGEAEGWKVVVENKPGAVTTVAGLDVLRQPADGYSIFAMSLPISAAPAFLPNMPFRPASDFAPVIKVSTSYNVLVVNPSVPAKSVADLVALIKSQPNKLTFSSGGFGTPAHLIGELFMLQTGTLAQHGQKRGPGHGRHVTAGREGARFTVTGAPDAKSTVAVVPAALTSVRSPSTASSA